MSRNTLHVLRREVEFFGRMLPALALWIDGKSCRTCAAPATASQSAISLGICAECYSSSEGKFPSCSEPDVAVRRWDDAICWFATGLDSIMPGEGLSRIYAFDRRHYEQQLGGSAAELPEFSRTEVRLLVDRTPFFPPESALYTDPEEPDDFHGRKLLASLAQLLAAEDLAICCEPQLVRTVRIGIEAPGVPEVVVQLDACAGRMAVRFIANPALPWWLTSGPPAAPQPQS